ncbi:hypothetical protein DZC52_03635 [Wenzhouxiangella sediminis]|uniref:Uncharacterized protein n=2 Tax=Wenzhouxiangella sediminis TaxID=1792836 RepID=A0A3E1KBA0_9GAMM|nr:hypothetical protein DZC52_03635 [Wenzhouxiangella sediminis]
MPWPLIPGGQHLVETTMTKGRDTQNREGKKKPIKTLKEKRADKAAKRSGTYKVESINNVLAGKPSSR